MWEKGASLQGSAARTHTRRERIWTPGSRGLLWLQDILINVTRFFRDPEPWDSFHETVQSQEGCGGKSLP